MGQLGSDAAIESSDIVLVNDNIKDLYTLKKIAKMNNNIVIQNIVFSIVCKVLFIALGAMSIIPLSFAVFADVGVMLLCVLNSLRINLIK